MRVHLIFWFIALPLCTLAQRNGLYLKGGLNIASISSINKSNYDEVDAIASFHAGILANLRLGKSVYLQPSLLFTGKGAKVRYGGPSQPYYFRTTGRPYYIELPLNVVFKLPFHKKLNFFAGTGGYAAVAVGGKNKGEIYILGERNRFETKIEYDGIIEQGPPGSDFLAWAGLSYMNRFDCGLTATAGFTVKRTLVSVNYEYGLMRIERQKGGFMTDENRNRVFSLSLGWQIF